MQTPNEDQDSNVIRDLKLEVEIAMQVGGAFEDCVTPAQAVDLVRTDAPLLFPSRPGRPTRAALKMAA